MGQGKGGGGAVERGRAEQIMWIIIPGQRPDEPETLTKLTTALLRRSGRKDTVWDEGGFKNL